MGTGYEVNGYEVRNPHTLAIYFRWQDTHRERVMHSVGERSGVMPAGIRVVLSKEQEGMMVARYVADEGWQAICREYGIGKPRFRKILEEHGVRWRGRGKKVATDGKNTGGVKNGAAAPQPFHPGETGAVLVTQSSALSPSSPPTPPAAPVERVIEVQELEDVKLPPYAPPAVVRSGSVWHDLAGLDGGKALLQPELVGDGRDVLAQLGRLNSLIRELRSIEGVVVQGSVSIALNVEAQI